MVFKSASFPWPVALLLVVLIAGIVSALPRIDGPDGGHSPKGPPPPPNGPPHHGGGGHHRIPYPPPGPPPEYLQEVSEKARNEHLRLLMEGDEKPKGQLKEEMAKWAEKSGAKAEFDKYMADHQQKRVAFHELMAANLAGDALAAHNKIWEVTENDQLTRSEECQQIQTVLEELKMKIRALVPPTAPQIMGPPPAGCFQGRGGGPPPPFPPYRGGMGSEERLPPQAGMMKQH